MKILKNAVIAAAALTMVATPIAASAAPTAAPAAARASVQLDESSAQADFNDWLLPILAIIAIFGAAAVGLSNHSNNPTSV